MKSALKGKVRGTPSNDMGNAFIWSCFKYYLRQPTDSYIVFSPVKYWKAQHLINKQFLGGYAFNRRHFHTNIDACIMCALWSNEDAKTATDLTLTGYDIVDGKLTEYPEKLPLKRIFTNYSGVYYDKRIFPEDTNDGILTAHDGLEVAHGIKKKIKPIYNGNMLGYLVVDGPGFDNPDLHACLLAAGIYNGNGFHLRKDNYLEKLLMFCASRYITYNRGWTQRARIMKSADGSARFAADVASGKLAPFLLKCLLFTYLEMQNHMRTFTGYDRRFNRNELCFDDTNGETLATRDIQGLTLNETEKALMAQWQNLSGWAKKQRRMSAGAAITPPLPMGSIRYMRNSTPHTRMKQRVKPSMTMWNCTRL
ncbi:MAG: hypothetical protein LBO05_14475 [Deltaproteobacteria bacterium]|jgi:hypothetical protein|nr:hypothetical protein [Deltaproteobacteria bacterium]